MKPLALVGSGAALERCAGVLVQLGHDPRIVAPDTEASPVDQVRSLAATGEYATVVYDLTSAVAAPGRQQHVADLVVVAESWGDDVDVCGLVIMSDFGRSSDLHDWRIDHIGLQAAGLWMAVSGSPDRSPLATTSTIVDSLVAYALTSAILMQHLGTTGCGAPTWLSRLGVTLACQPYLDLRYQYTHRDSARSGMPFPMMLCPASDGYLGVNVLTDDQWYLLCALADRGDLLADERFATPALRLTGGAVLTDEFREWAATVEAEPTFHQGQAMRVPLAYLPTLDDLVEHLREMRATTPTSAAIGEGAILPLGFSRSVLPAARERDDSTAWDSFESAAPAVGPLRGVRVVDLTMFWAGPFTSLYLASYGATVVKVESPTRLDGWRGLAGVSSVEASHLYNGVNLNKFGLSLDLKDADDLARIKDLIAGADIVLDNFSPGVMSRFGLDDDELRRLNPTLVHLSMPAFGSTGEWRNYVGFAPTMEPLSGMPHLTRYSVEDEPRLLGNSVADPAAGWAGVLALLGELAAQHAPGFVRLDLSQHRSLQGLLVPDIDRFVQSAVASTPSHAVARCDEPAGWVSISFRSDHDSAALAGWVEQHPTLWQPGSDEANGRAETAVDGFLDGNFVVDKWQAATELQAAGFTAMPVLNASDVVDAERRLGRDGCMVELAKAEAGVARYAGLPLELVGQARGLAWVGPRLGEHNSLLEKRGS